MSDETPKGPKNLDIREQAAWLPGHKVFGLVLDNIRVKVLEQVATHVEEPADLVLEAENDPEVRGTIYSEISIWKEKK